MPWPKRSAQRRLQKCKKAWTRSMGMLAHKHLRHESPFTFSWPNWPPKAISDSSHGFGTPKTPKSGPLGNWQKSDLFSTEIDHILTRKNHTIFWLFFERKNKWLREIHFHGSFVQMASGASFWAIATMVLAFLNKSSHSFGLRGFVLSDSSHGFGFWGFD